jgi:hypothetical protein
MSTPVPPGSVLDRHRIGLRGQWAAWSYRDWLAVFRRDLTERVPTAHAIKASGGRTICGKLMVDRNSVAIPAPHARLFTQPCPACEQAKGFATDGAALPARAYNGRA